MILVGGFFSTSGEIGIVFLFDFILSLVMSLGSGVFLDFLTFSTSIFF